MGIAKVEKKTDWNHISFKKKFDPLFWNSIKELYFKEINFNYDSNKKPYKAFRVSIPENEVKAVRAYTKKLKEVKEESSEFITGIKVPYNKEIEYYFQGFIAELAFIKLGLYFGLDISWYDALVPHGKGDNGDATINNYSVDIKSKAYKTSYDNLHYDIKTIGKSDYFVFTYVEEQEDGSIIVDILGYHDKKHIKSLSKGSYWSSRYGGRSYEARRIKYNTLNPIETFFKLPF